MTSVICGKEKYIRHLFNVLSSKTILQHSICTSSPVLKKHWNQKFRKLRSQKVIKVDLPDFEEYKKSSFELSKEEIRSKMKEKGVLQSVPWTEKPMFISTTGDIFEPYVPPEGDGKVSFISKEGAKQKMEFVEKRGKSFFAIRKLKKNDDDFEIDDFLIEAQDIYVKAHSALMNVRKDKEELLLHVTERAYPEMLHNALDKTIHWKMIGLLDKPKLVQARTTDLVSKDNIFCQLTVRFHTQQMLAIYDRFGRLMYGSEILAKDVLEYVVFEKHITNKYGKWRVHAKIIPEWMPPKDAVPKTYKIEDVSEDELKLSSSSESKDDKPQIPPPTSQDSPALAAA